MLKLKLEAYKIGSVNTVYPDKVKLCLDIYRKTSDVIVKYGCTKFAIDLDDLDAAVVALKKQRKAYRQP